MTGGNGERNGVHRNAKVTIRDRWEAVRYGPVGRYLGFGLAFLAVFVFISLVLWSLEKYRR
jgi:hypothetical protein